MICSERNLTPSVSTTLSINQPLYSVHIPKVLAAAMAPIWLAERWRSSFCCCNRFLQRSCEDLLVIISGSLPSEVSSIHWSSHQTPNPLENHLDLAKLKGFYPFSHHHGFSGKLPPLPWIGKDPIGGNPFFTSTNPSKAQGSRAPSSSSRWRTTKWEGKRLNNTWEKKSPRPIQLNGGGTVFGGAKIPTKNQKNNRNLN